MKKQLLICTVLLNGLMQPGYGMPITSQATITHTGGPVGMCSIELNVDGVAEAEISGDVGVLRTLSGMPSAWQRFQCNEPIPRNPVDFQLLGVRGRGNIRLLRDPRTNTGSAVIHINDPQPGRGVYNFDFQWRRAAAWPPATPSVPPQMPQPPQQGHGPGHGGPGMATAIRICQDSVTSRLSGDGYSYVKFERTVPDNGPGNKDWVIGTVTGRRGSAVTRFSFSCSADFHTGQVRSVDVRR